MPAATLFNSQTGRAAVVKSWQAGSRRFIPSPKLVPTVELPKDSPDPLASKLARVQDELVEKMQGNADAAEVSKLSRALKDVREVFHLVTGQAKPGVIRENSPRNRQRNAPKPQPLPDDGPPDANQS